MMMAHLAVVRRGSSISFNLVRLEEGQVWESCEEYADNEALPCRATNHHHHHHHHREHHYHQLDVWRVGKSNQSQEAHPGLVWSGPKLTNVKWHLTAFAQIITINKYVYSALKSFPRTQHT